MNRTYHKIGWINAGVYLSASVIISLLMADYPLPRGFWWLLVLFIGNAGLLYVYTWIMLKRSIKVGDKKQILKEIVGICSFWGLAIGIVIATIFSKQTLLLKNSLLSDRILLYSLTTILQIVIGLIVYTINVPLVNYKAKHLKSKK